MISGVKERSTPLMKSEFIVRGGVDGGVVGVFELELDLPQLIKHTTKKMAAKILFIL
jgi:hypothetical protein